MTEWRSWFISVDAAVSKLNCVRITIGFALSLVSVFHVYAADLNGAWASDPNVCSQIFVRKNNKTSIADHSDLYGNGFIIEGDEFTDKLTTCHIKDRKADNNTIRLIVDCSIDYGHVLDQIVLRIDDNDRLTRFSAGMLLAYFRCPAVE